MKAMEFKRARAVKQELMILRTISFYPQFYNQAYRPEGHTYSEPAEPILTHTVTPSFVPHKRQKDVAEIICFPLPSLQLAANHISTFYCVIINAE